MTGEPINLDPGIIVPGVRAKLRREGLRADQLFYSDKEEQVSRELTILRIIAEQNGEAYGNSIHEAFEAATGKDLAFVSIYAVLDALESKGLITSRQGGATPERGNRPKRLCVITEAGQKALGQ